VTTGEVQGIYIDLLLHDMGRSLSGEDAYGRRGASGEVTVLRRPNGERRRLGCELSRPYLHDVALRDWSKRSRNMTARKSGARGVQELPTRSRM